jgi:hypothetical protein
MKYPAITVNAKLIPVATGTITVNSASDNALKNTSAEMKINPKASIT